MPDPLEDPVHQALGSAHASLAVQNGQARRYPAAVAPFAAVDELTPAALQDLVALLAPSESVYLLGERPPDLPNLRWDGVVPCFQMTYPPGQRLPARKPATQQIHALDCTHSPEMLALISVAFPGYFRAETCRMGRYWGIRDTDGTLIAMGGERFIIAPPGQPAWREISGLCTHPTRPGKGLGTALLSHILHQHRAEGSRSWLHVTTSNTRAIALYQRLGFQTHRHIDAHRMKRVDS